MPPLYLSEFYANLSILPLVISLIKNPRALQLHLVRNSFLMKRWLRGKEATASCHLQVGGVCGCVYCIREHSLEKEVWISQPTAQSPSSETCSSVRSGWSTGPSLFLETLFWGSREDLNGLGVRQLHSQSPACPIVISPASFMSPSESSVTPAPPLLFLPHWLASLLLFNI